MDMSVAMEVIGGTSAVSMEIVGSSSAVAMEVDSGSSVVAMEVAGGSATANMEVDSYQVITQTADDLEYYNGEYDVMPSAHEDVVLQTTKKLMHSDVTVQEIPCSEVSNTAGGTTIYIANEV